MRFAVQNLRNALQIAKCKVRGINLYPVLLSVTKKMTRKTILNVYYTFSVIQHHFINILQQLGQNNFENYSFMLTKFDHYFV